MHVAVRHATLDDAEPIAAVLNGVIAEGSQTILDGPLSERDQRAFMATLDARSRIHVALVDGSVVGVQSVDLFSTASTAMAHVATMGTWIRADARGRGIGGQLAAQSFGFAIASGYLKVVVQVLAGNARALAFYRRLGFTDIGIARRHVRLNGRLQDEIYLEKHLT